MTEAVILRHCTQVLALCRNARLLAFRRINVSPVIRGGGKQKLRFSKNEMSGFSDLIVFLPGGVTLFIELKTQEGTQSDDQIEFESDICPFGHRYHVVRSAPELEVILIANGIVLPYRRPGL